MTSGLTVRFLSFPLKACLTLLKTQAPTRTGATIDASGKDFPSLGNALGCPKRSSRSRFMAVIVPKCPVVNIPEANVVVREDPYLRLGYQLGELLFS